MPFRPDDVEAADFSYSLVLDLPDVLGFFTNLLGSLPRHFGQIAPSALRYFLTQPFGVSAKNDVGPSAGHVGGDGDAAWSASLGYDQCLPFMLFGVENVRCLQGTDLVVITAVWIVAA